MIDALKQMPQTIQRLITIGPTMSWKSMPPLARCAYCSTGNSQQKRGEVIKYHAIITLFAISDNRAGVSHHSYPYSFNTPQSWKSGKKIGEIARMPEKRKSRSGILSVFRDAVSTATDCGDVLIDSYACMGHTKANKVSREIQTL